MNIVFMWIGILFIVTILLIICSTVIRKIIEDIKYRKEIYLETFWIGQLSQIDRYCDYEFDKVGLLAREIIKSIRNGTGLDAGCFRELLREKDKEGKV